jgi:TPR repeat protein
LKRFPAFQNENANIGNSFSVYPMLRSIYISQDKFALTLFAKIIEISKTEDPLVLYMNDLIHEPKFGYKPDPDLTFQSLKCTYELKLVRGIPNYDISFADGISVKKDVQKAIQIYHEGINDGGRRERSNNFCPSLQKASRLCNQLAIYNLGDCYTNGVGVLVNLEYQFYSMLRILS